MMKATACRLAALALLVFLSGAARAFFNEEAHLRSPYLSVISEATDSVVLELRLPDAAAYLAAHSFDRALGAIEGPQEGCLVVLPGAAPYAEILEVEAFPVDASGELAAGAPASGELSATLDRRLVVLRELGWMREHRLGVCFVRPYQRAYENQGYQRYLYSRVRFRISSRTAATPSETPEGDPPALAEALAASVINPRGLTAPGEAPPREDPQPRALPERYLKVMTSGEGIFEVSGGPLLELDPGLTVETLAVSAGGRPVPTLLFAAEGRRKNAGPVQLTDRLLFHRAGSTSPFDRLEAAFIHGGTPSMMPDLPPAASGATEVRHEEVFEVDADFVSETEMGEKQANFWFWTGATPLDATPSLAQLRVEVQPPGIVSGTVQARIELWSPAPNALRQVHAVEADWEGFTSAGPVFVDVTDGPFPRLVLRQELFAERPAPATAALIIRAPSAATVYLDRVALTYTRALGADSGAALSAATETRALQWRQEAWVFAAVPGASPAAGRGTGFRIPAGARVFTVTSEARAPERLALRTRPRLTLPDRFGTLVVSHADFIPALGPWLDYRRAEGHSMAVVDVEDLYDLFGDGSMSPRAIRGALQHAYAEMSLGSVILCGDASWDTWGRFPEPVPNWIPSYHIEAEYPSDNYYRQLVGPDAIPDVMLSRLPVQSATDARNALDKIIHYPRAANGEWAARYLLLVDNSFEDYVERLLGANVPLFMQARTLRFRDYPLTDNFYYPEDMLQLPEFRIEGGKTSPWCTRDVIREMDRGNLFVMYYGHGGGNVMGHERYFFGGDSAHSDVLKLRENVPAFFFIYSCWTGWFDFARPKWNIGLGEEILRQPGRGAVGLFLSTGRGLPIHHESLAGHVHRLLFADGIRNIGAASLVGQVLACAETGSTEPVYMFTLFGDCLLELPLPREGLSVTMHPAAAPATAERRLSISGLPAGATEAAVMAVDSEGQRVLDATVPVDAAPLVVSIPGVSTAAVGPLRVAVAAGALYGGTAGIVVRDDPHTLAPAITDGTPDLALTRQSVAVISPAPMEGETIVFAVTVENRGTASALNFPIEAYDGKIGDIETRLRNQVMLPPVVVPRLDPGETAVRHIRWDPWDNAGRHSVFFVVDPRFQVPEENRRNNLASLTVNVRSKPDLVVGASIHESTETGELRLAVLVKNQGGSRAEAAEGGIVTLLRYFGADGPLKTVQLDSVPPLEPGEVVVMPPVILPREVSGKGGSGEVVSIEVEVDPIEIVNESTHANNRQALRLPTSHAGK